MEVCGSEARDAVVQAAPVPNLEVFAPLGSVLPFERLRELCRPGRVRSGLTEMLGLKPQKPEIAPIDTDPLQSTRGVVNVECPRHVMSELLVFTADMEKNK